MHKHNNLWRIGLGVGLALLARGGDAPALAADRVVLAENFTATW